MCFWGERRLGVILRRAGSYGKVEGKHPQIRPTRPTLNSIRQTDVDTLMIRTQSRVRVRVRVIYLNQTGVRYHILGGVEVRVMHSRSDALSSNPTHSILNCFFP